MAQKFNDGQTFGQIRTILNDNADELNKTTAKATPASGTKGKAGLVKAPLYADILSGAFTGCLSFSPEGVAQMIDQKISEGTDILEFASYTARSGISSPFMLYGSYTNGWYGAESNNYSAVVRFHTIRVGAVGLAEAVDFYTGKTWVYAGMGWVMTGGSDANALKKGDAAGGSLAGTYPNPAIADSVNLPGSPTTTTQYYDDCSTKIATTAFVKSNNVRHSFLVPGVNIRKQRYYVSGETGYYGAPLSFGILVPFCFRNLDQVGLCLVANAAFVRSKSGFDPNVGNCKDAFVKYSPDNKLAVCVFSGPRLMIGPSYDIAMGYPFYTVTYGDSFGDSIPVCKLAPRMILPYDGMSDLNAAESVDIYNLL